jgi:hypothetical protein
MRTNLVELAGDLRREQQQARLTLHNRSTTSAPLCLAFVEWAADLFRQVCPAGKPPSRHCGNFGGTLNVAPPKYTAPPLNIASPKNALS